MNRSLRIVLILLAAIAGGLLIFNQVNTHYLSKRKAHLSTIDNLTTRLAAYQKNARDHVRVKGELQAIIDRTLGGSIEIVDHRLRTRLNRLAEQAQLQSPTVGTGSSGSARRSPAASAFRSFRDLYVEIDFVEVEGWISGTGTFEQALRLIDAIEAEPWIKRINQIRLDPKDNGSRFDVSLRLTTLFLPGQAPDPDALLSPVPTEFERLAVFLQSNPFRVPPPAPVAEPPQQARTEAPPQHTPTFPYQRWKLTGIAHGPNGPEVWLLNAESKETRVLSMSEKLHEMELMAIETDSAVFRIGEKRVRIAVGSRMNERTPARQ